MNASGGGRFVALAGLTVLGVALGAFTAITFGPQVGAGIGITLGYVTWMALMGDRRRADRHRRRGPQEPLLPRSRPSTPARRRSSGYRNGCRPGSGPSGSRRRWARSWRPSRPPPAPRSTSRPRSGAARPRPPPSRAGPAFLVLGGPRRVFRAGKRAVTGAPEPLPESMLPEEIEKTLRELGDDGDEGPRRARARFRGLRQAGAAGTEPGCGRSSC